MDEAENPGTASYGENTDEKNVYTKGLLWLSEKQENIYGGSHGDFLFDIRKPLYLRNQSDRFKQEPAHNRSRFGLSSRLQERGELRFVSAGEGLQ